MILNRFVAIQRYRDTLFYALAFMPLLVIAYYHHFVRGLSILGILIPFYGFLLLLLKKDRIISFSRGSGRLSRFAGLALMFMSFLVYYVAAIYASSSLLYAAEGIFYSFYVVGLLLIFFNISILRESLSVIFLLVVGGSIYYIGDWLEYPMGPLVPYFVQIMLPVLTFLGIPVIFDNANPNLILLNTSKGPVPVAFAAGCIGIQSFLAFSVIIVVTMMEDPANLREKVVWSVGGVIGTFVLNIFRVSLIGVVIYYFGYENWGEIHSWIGYALFLLWLVFFFIVFSNRDAIRSKIDRLIARV
jgi:exosortase/archaeosortase family protein